MNKVIVSDQLEENTLGESKMWQEIKLRKPSQEICEIMQVVIIDFNEVSASKALERLILNYPQMKKIISDLEEAERKQRFINNELETELTKHKKLIADIRQSYTNFTALLSE